MHEDIGATGLDGRSGRELTMLVDRSPMSSERPAPSTLRPSWRWLVGRGLGALAVLVVGVVHLQQYLGPYAAIPTIGTLFVVNFVAATVIGLALLAPIEHVAGGWAGVAVALVTASGMALAAVSFLLLLVSEHTPGLALAITGDRVDAEEVAQDAFVRAWRYAGSYDPRRGAVPAWLLGIVRNVALDRIRVSSRRRELPVDTFPAAIQLEHVADSVETVGGHDTVARIVASMRSLPAEQREAVLAVTLYGFRASELSAATGVPLGTVKTRIRLGLRKLRDQLGARVP